MSDDKKNNLKLIGKNEDKNFSLWRRYYYNNLRGNRGNYA